MLKQLSHSAIETFRDCPKKYFFNYIEKPEIARRVTAETYMGNAVHRGIANLYSLAADGHLYPLESTIADYLGEWEKPGRSDIVVVNENLSVDEYIENGRRMLTEFYAKNQPFNSGRLLGAELMLHFDLPGTSFRFKVIIDRLWKRSDGIVEIWDYKTSRRLPQGPKDYQFRRQMGLYCLAVRAKYPQLGQVELVQYNLRHDIETRSVFNPDELEQLTDEIKFDVYQILEAIRLESFSTNEGGHCLYCAYNQICPAKRHRAMLVAESGTNGNGERTTAQTAQELADRYLEVHRQIGELEAEKQALKSELLRTAAELDLCRFIGTRGEVTVSVLPAEKFVNKSMNAKRYAELSGIARELGLELCFTLDERLLYKDIYSKGTLTEEQRNRLLPFIVRFNNESLRTKYSTDDDD